MAVLIPQYNQKIHIMSFTTGKPTNWKEILNFDPIVVTDIAVSTTLSINTPCLSIRF
jgi:hypothetical protein